MSRRFFILSVVLAVARAIDFYITSPYDLVKWTVGNKETVTWNILPGGAEVRAINVDLMDGDDSMANVVAEIAKNLPPTATSASWEVPASIKPGSKYFIRVSGNDPALTVQRFSHRFTIQSSGKPCSSSSTSISKTISIITTSSTTSNSAITSTKSSEASASTSEESTSSSLRKRQTDDSINLDSRHDSILSMSAMILILFAFIL